MPEHSWTKFIEAKRKELQRLNNAYKNTLSNAKVELLQGFGKIVDPHTVDVDGKKYTVSMRVPALCWWRLRTALRPCQR
jgi:glutathione reductase (NADPH)